MGITAAPGLASSMMLPPAVDSYFSAGGVMDPGTTGAVGSDAKLVLSGANAAMVPSQTTLAPAIQSFSMAMAGATPVVSDIANSKVADIGASPSPHAQFAKPLYL